MFEKVSFSFGKNWQKFLNYLNKQRIESAILSFTDFLKVKNLEGKTFLDIGCGSGLFSYAAFILGAKLIVSFDVDPNSVKSCKLLHRKENYPDNWVILHGSILDRDFYKKLDKFDIVYSWGVLHHTGRMWNAIRNAATLVKNDGYFYFAIYNKVEGIRGSNFWFKVKKIYNSSPKFLKHLIEELFILNNIIDSLLNFKNPIKFMRDYGKERGMHYRIDVIDWLGGYPYEFATAQEIIDFMKLKFPNYKLMNLKRNNGLGNNWFLFKAELELEFKCY